MAKTQIFKELWFGDNKERVLCTSYSQIETYLSCGYRWYRDYLLGERESATSEALALGSAIHETLEDYFGLIKDGVEVTLGEAQDLLEFNMDCNDIPFPNVERKIEATNQHLEMIRGLVEGDSNFAQFMQDKRVVATEKAFQYKVELPFSIRYGENVYNEIYIIGSIDFVVEDKQGNIHVVDFKSGAKLFDSKKLKENLQLPIYSLIVKEIYGVLPKTTQYYFTRFDTFQSVMPLALNEETCEHLYYKNGKLKQKQRTIEDISSVILGIFKEQYVLGYYKPSKTPLCSWCTHGKYDKNNCPHAMFYKRKDIPFPKKNTKRI